MHQQPPTRFFPPPRPPGLTTQPPVPTNDLQRGHFHHAYHFPPAELTNGLQQGWLAHRAHHPTSNKAVSTALSNILSPPMTSNEAVSTTVPTTQPPVPASDLQRGRSSHAYHSPPAELTNGLQRGCFLHRTYHLISCTHQ